MHRTLPSFASRSSFALSRSPGLFTGQRASPLSFRRFLSTTDQQEAFGVLPASEARGRLPEFDVLVDVREPDEWAAGVIGSPKTITLGRLMRDVGTEEMQGLKGKRLLVYCRSGARSALACGVLAKNGFQATNLAGGFRGWREANGPEQA